MESLCSGNSSYRFGAFELNPQTGELSNAGKKSQLRDQPLKLLLALLEQPGELVTREALVRRLWPEGTFVDFDRGLNKAVLHLREALADSAEHPQFIETLPRKGYRFVAPLTQDSQESPTVPLRDTKSQARFLAWTVALAAVACLVIVMLANVGGARDWISNRSHPTSQITALAVIPLENLSGNPDQEYFADGMTDELITDLAKTSSARITSRTSVMRYKGIRKSVRDIGRELNVDAVVEGTVTRSGDRVRITAQLIQVATDMHLWAETYDRDLSEVIHLQSEVATDIARHISTVVRPRIRAGPRTRMPTASISRGATSFISTQPKAGNDPLSYSTAPSNRTRDLRRPTQVWPTLTSSRVRTAQFPLRKPSHTESWRRPRRWNWMRSWRVPTMRWPPSTPGTTGIGQTRTRNSSAASP
jgi:TolB-like protein/DNA-binding winged helix-turn-helix (wHTH) protein